MWHLTKTKEKKLVAICCVMFAVPWFLSNRFVYATINVNINAVIQSVHCKTEPKFHFVILQYNKT
jgi:hypothetical protein